MTPTFAWEPLDRLLGDGFEALLIEHWHEVANDKDVIPFAPDWDRYRDLEKAGTFKILAMRRGNIFVGYNAFFVNPSLHYRHTLHALNDVIYLDPLERPQGGGIKLIRQAERDLIGMGAVKIMYHTKPNVILGHGKARGTLGDVLSALGYNHVESQYAKIVRR